MSKEIDKKERNISDEKEIIELKENMLQDFHIEIDKVESELKEKTEEVNFIKY